MVVAGRQGLDQITTGNYNLCLGHSSVANPTSAYGTYGAGHALTTSDSSNILIQAYGTSGWSNVLKIGDGTGTNAGQINTTYICGIYGKTPSGTKNVALIDSNDQLGSVASLTDHGILLGSCTSAITATAAPTDGQLLIGSSSNDPVLATLTAGTNVTVTNGAGSISLSSTINAINDQTDSYQLVAGDAGKFITMTKATSNTLTVPKDATVNFAIGTYITVYQGGAGTTTFAPEDGTITIRSRSSYLNISAQYGVAKLYKIASNLWSLSGDLA